MQCPTSKALLSNQAPLDQQGESHREGADAPGRAQQLVQQDSSRRNHGLRVDRADLIQQNQVRRH
jgi:hypothetical protein